ncbi:MAG: ABC transporter substrate-binding protein [Polaromonas sp.]|nr:ABC transporter substrate-binding protein [Polaromonas sp.]
MTRNKWLAIVSISLLSFCVPLIASAQALKVAIVSRTVFYAPLWIAAERGFFKQAGIDAEIVVYDNAEKITEDLKKGVVQIAISTPEGVITDAYANGSLRIIAGNAEKLPHFIIAKPEIRTLAQIKGRTIGVLSTQEGSSNLIREILANVGLTPKDYVIEQVGGAPTRWKLLKEGKIDVGLQPFPLSYEADAAGFSNLGAIASLIPDYQFTSVNVDDLWAKRNQSVVINFLKALKLGQEDIAKNPAFAIAVSSKQLQTSAALAERALNETARLKILSGDLSVSRPGLGKVFETLVAANLVPKNRAFEFQKIVDESYLAAASR